MLLIFKCFSFTYFFLEVNAGLKPYQRISMRNIYAVGRTISVEAMYSKLLDYVNTFMMNASLSKQVVGFDIVDSEDVYVIVNFYSH